MKQLLWGLILVMLFLPWVQRSLEIFPIKDLNGDFVPAPKPVFDLSTWKMGEFQSKTERYTEEKIGFHNFLVRLRNQLDYSVFRMANAEGVVVGKTGELYEQDYIRAYLGGDFIGQSTIEKKFRRLKFVQEKLKSMGKDLVLVFEPGRASYSPENIPDRFKYIYPPGNSNYNCMLKEADKLKINHIDFNKYFKDQKDKSKYPLYPKQGVHWSQYGSYLVADSLKHYIEKLRGIQLGDLHFQVTGLSDSLKYTDYDAGKSMNLLCEMAHPKMAYPNLTFTDKPVSDRPSVLVISDSYYWNLYIAEIPMHLFRHGEFWYYNAIAQFDQEKAKEVPALDLKKEIETKDVIMIMVTERFLYNYDWRFIDNVYELFTPELQIDAPYRYANNVRGASDWFTLMIQKAKDARITLEEAIRRDALYMFENDDKERYMLFAGLEHYYVGMRADASWMEKIAQKSKLKGISTEAQMKLDAEYMFAEAFPKVFKQYQKMQEISETIQKDPVFMQKILQNQYYLTKEDMLWQEAYARLHGFSLL
jgi:hypothetical protein